jgi:hypothetical protein
VQVLPPSGIKSTERLRASILVVLQRAGRGRTIHTTTPSPPFCQTALPVLLLVPYGSLASAKPPIVCFSSSQGGGASACVGVETLSGTQASCLSKSKRPKVRRFHSEQPQPGSPPPAPHYTTFISGHAFVTKISCALQPSRAAHSFSSLGTSPVDSCLVGSFWLPATAATSPQLPHAICWRLSALVSLRRSEGQGR